MIQFKIKGQEYTVKEPTIRDYYKLQNELAMQDINAKLNIIAHLSDCETRVLKVLDKHQFLELWNVVVEQYLEITETAPFHRNFMHNGNLYGFINMDSITIGEFADMDVLRNHPQAQQMLHSMLAILYRPAIMITDTWMKVDDYDSESAQQRAEEFLDLPLKYVYGALNFFLQISNYCLNAMLDSLTLKVMKTQMTETEKELTETAILYISDLLENGTTSSYFAPETILQRLKKLAEQAQLESSTTLRTEKTNKRWKRWSVKRWLWRQKDKLRKFIIKRIIRK